MKQGFSYSTFLLITLLFACDLNVHYKELSSELDSMLIEDQRYRQLYMDLSTNSSDSLRVNELLTLIRGVDSMNSHRVSDILDSYGWLGVEEVGETASNCLYLVIQHSDQKTREKYLPMMREAVKKGKARAIDLAFLIDRVAVERGNKQMYGTQLFRDRAGEFHFFPIEDELGVNIRRKNVGLNSIEDRAKEFGFVYKKPIE